MITASSVRQRLAYRGFDGFRSDFNDEGVHVMGEERVIVQVDFENASAAARRSKEIGSSLSQDGFTVERLSPTTIAVTKEDAFPRLKAGETLMVQWVEVSTLRRRAREVGMSLVTRRERRSTVARVHLVSRLEESA